MKIRELHNLVQIIKRTYFDTVSKLTKEQCIDILKKFDIPTKDIISVIKKTTVDKTKRIDDEYDF